MPFIKSVTPPNHDADQAYYCCFSADNILLNMADSTPALPRLTSQEAKKYPLKDSCFIGFFNNTPCYAVTAPEPFLSDAGSWLRLKDFYVNDGGELASVAGYARQIADWNMNFRFCGRCSAPTVRLASEHARQCKKCQLIHYPRISPAIITAVIKDDQILLARGRNYSDKEMFSVLAGFVEPGESLEDAVRREIMEESGIAVTNIRYFKSQPWPFPDSLMIGFLADYHAGTIKIDENEIAEAGWFSADALPKVPDKKSLSSELIRWFVSAHKK